MLEIVSVQGFHDILTARLCRTADGELVMVLRQFRMVGNRGWFAQAAWAGGIDDPRETGEHQIRSGSFNQGDGSDERGVTSPPDLEVFFGDRMLPFQVRDSLVVNGDCERNQISEFGGARRFLGIGFPGWRRGRDVG